MQPPIARETVLAVGGGLQSVLDSLGEAILLIGPQGIVTGANRAAEQLFLIPAARLIGSDGLSLMADRQSRGFLDYLAEMLLPNDPAKPGIAIELVGRRSDGALIPIEVTSGRIVPPGPAMFTLTIRDISALKAREKEMRDGANRDRLTGVATRAHVEQVAEPELFRVSRYNRPLSVLIFDVDHFKQVNDAHGHAAGDRVLREIAQRCKDLIRASDLIGRWGGEEFLVMTPETEIDGGRTLGERLRRGIADSPVILDTGERVSVTISVGIAERVPGDPDFATIVRRADAALYRAKAAGRNRVELATKTEMVARSAA